MSLKSKAKAAKKRDQVKAQQEKDRQALIGNAVKLQTMTSGFARTERSKDHVVLFEQSKMPQYVKNTPITHSHDLADRFDMTLKSKPVVMGEATEDLLRRQAEAVERAKEYKSRVGPAYNKGPTVLLSEGEIAAEKRGELRRRS